MTIVHSTCRPPFDWSRPRHREELEKAREALEKAKAAAGLEMNQDYQSRLNRASKVRL